MDPPDPPREYILVVPGAVSLSEAYSYGHGELFQYDMLEYSVVGRGTETDACLPDIYSIL